MRVNFRKTDFVPRKPARRTSEEKSGCTLFHVSFGSRTIEVSAATCADVSLCTGHLICDQ